MVLKGGTGRGGRKSLMIPELKIIIITILKDGQKTLKPIKPVLLYMLMYRYLIFCPSCTFVKWMPGLF